MKVSFGTESDSSIMERFQPESDKDWLAILIFPLLGLFVAAIYWPGFLDFANPLFANRISFLAWSIAFILLAIIIMINSRFLLLRMAAAMTGLLILLSPAGLPLVYGEYHPYAEPAAGHEMVWLTPPQSAFESAFKNAQRLTEHLGCNYTLLGWDQENNLYFSSDCDRIIQQYTPRTKRPFATELTPEELDSLTPVDDGYGNSYPLLPPGFSSATEHFFIPYQTSSSPDGRWSAVAIKNYYGPRDVVVISRIQSPQT